MAGQFALAIEATLKWEGGYVNDPNDSGGETYRGLTRRDDGTWVGWSLIARHNQECVAAGYSQSEFKARLDADQQLLQMVKDFYHVNYWNPLYEQIDDAGMATKLFDTGVLAGIHTAVTLLQRTLNLAISGLPAIGVDGKFGEGTLAALNSLGSFMPAFVDEYRWQVLYHYEDVVVANIKDVNFLKGWTKRTRKLY